MYFSSDSILLLIWMKNVWLINARNFPKWVRLWLTNRFFMLFSP